DYEMNIMDVNCLSITKNTIKNFKILLFKDR
ncbi:unnamed protein product, partial [marine sediment metagenome]